MYDLISKTIDKEFSKGAFKSNFFKKDDLISDLYLYLAEFDKDFTEIELLEIIKKKYFNYFEVYDIKDRNSYDKFEDVGSRGIKEGVVHVSNEQEIKIYEFFEKILWKDGIKCSKCKSKDCYPNKDSVRQHDCRNCGNIFSFSQNTNMRQKNINALQNIIKVYNLVLQGIICLRDIQEKTGLSKKRKVFN